MKRSYLFVLSLLLLAAAQALSAHRYASPVPPFDRPVIEDYAVTDMSAVLMGARRFGSDLAFIQMLQYYGSEDSEAQEFAADLRPDNRLMSYHRLLEHCLRIASLDPYFHYAYLFGAGALAFNLNRTDEALNLLRRGVEADPTFWRFRLYAGAIAYRKSAEIDKVIALLEQAILHPDCPSMLQNVLANIHRKMGNHRRAAEIYLHLLETSRDEEYVSLAREKLKELQSYLQ